MSFGSFVLSSHSGSAPAPFDAVDGRRLAGLEGSHPLHDVALDELVRPDDGSVHAEFSFDDDAEVGGSLAGTLRITPVTSLDERGAALRLVGLRLVERRHSIEERDRDGRVTRSERWVHADGTLFEEIPFTEPRIPATLASGEVWATAFNLPAPRLGPPSAHLGEAIVAWALEVRWDVPHGQDRFVAVHVPVLQHPDLIRAGVGRQGGEAVLASVARGGATLDVISGLPASSGSELVVRPFWPEAPGGGEVRVELHRRTNAPNAVEGIIAVAPITADLLRSGGSAVSLAIPPGAAPSFDGADLHVDYIIRVLVSLRFRPDAAIERPVAII